MHSFFFPEALTSPDTDSSLFSDPDQLKFHHLHGRNATILHNGLTAARPNATGEFNDAIVMSNRPLRDGELFEVVIDKMVDRWSGSLEAGKRLRKTDSAMITQLAILILLLASWLNKIFIIVRNNHEIERLGNH